MTKWSFSYARGTKWSFRAYLRLRSPYRGTLFGQVVIVKSIFKVLCHLSQNFLYKNVLVPPPIFELSVFFYFSFLIGSSFLCKERRCGEKTSLEEL